MSLLITGLAGLAVTGAVFVVCMFAAEAARERAIRQFFKRRDAEWRERRDHE